MTDTSAAAAPGTSPATTMLDASHFSRRFGERVAVDEVSFRVATGETWPKADGKLTESIGSDASARVSP